MGVTLRTVIQSMIGGLVSEHTGGNFANGAVSGAFVHLFNAEWKLGIHSNVSSDSEFTDGHAWITVTNKDGTVTTYGLWPDEHPITIDNGKGSDVRVNLEINSIPVASKYVYLNVQQH